MGIEPGLLVSTNVRPVLRRLIRRSMTRMRLVSHWVVITILATAVTLTGCPGEDLAVPKSSYFSQVLILDDGRLACIGAADYRVRPFSGDQLNYYLLDSGGQAINRRKIATGSASYPGPASLSADGDVYISGLFVVNPGIADFSGLAMRLSVDGRTIWKIAERDGLGSETFVVNELEDGRVVLVGSGYDGSLIIELDHNGEIIDTNVGTTLRARVAAIAEVGRIFVANNASPPVLGEFDTDANLIWQSSVLQYPDRSMYASELILAANGDIIVLALLGFEKDILVARVDDEGNLIWTREVTVLDRVDSEDAAAIGESGDGTLYVGGPNLLVRLDADGNETWRKTVPGTINGLAISADGIVHAVGFRQVDEEGVLVSRMLLMKFDADGNLLSDQLFIGVSEE